MIFDTHTHYDDAAFDSDRNELIESLPQKGVGRICNIGASMEGARASVGFSEKYDFVYAAAGVHPDEVMDFYKTGTPGAGYPGAEPADIKPEDSNEALMEIFERAFNEDIESETNGIFCELKELASRKKTVAIGEIGLDYHGFGVYEDKPCKELQTYWFAKQLKLAVELKKPVVIHSRNASMDTMEMMKKAHEKGLAAAVIHCYSYSRETALEYVDMGFYLGFGGVITYEGQKKLTKALEAAPMERILIETDCPYLTPVPIREKGVFVRNSSDLLPYVINKIAEIKGMSPVEIEKISWDNANRFYGIS